MLISFSPRKNAINRKKHGISLQRAEDFDLTTALIFPEDSQDYGELRYQAIGFLDAKLYVLTFTEAEDTIRAIRAFSLLMGFPKGACSGVFIEENAHEGRGLQLRLQGKCSSLRKAEKSEERIYAEET